MEVYVLELISQEYGTGVEFKETLGVFYNKQDAIDFMNNLSKKRDIELSKDEFDFYDCDKPFVLDSSFFSILNYTVK